MEDLADSVLKSAEFSTLASFCTRLIPVSIGVPANSFCALPRQVLLRDDLFAPELGGHFDRFFQFRSDARFLINNHSTGTSIAFASTAPDGTLRCGSTLPVEP